MPLSGNSQEGFVFKCEVKDQIVNIIVLANIKQLLCNSDAPGNGKCVVFYFLWNQDGLSFVCYKKKSLFFFACVFQLTNFVRLQVKMRLINSASTLKSFTSIGESEMAS